MNDNITLPRATVQQVLKTLEGIHRVDEYPELQPAVTALRAAMGQQAEPVEGNTLLKAFLASAKEAGVTHLQQAEPVPEPFDDLATELFVVAQRSPADDGFSDTIDRIESWLREHFFTQPQQQAEPVSTHRITSWGHCGVCRHDRIPGEGCARQECPDSHQRKEDK